MVKPSKTAVWARDARKAARDARDEANAAEADAAAKRDAVIEAAGRAADAHGRASDAIDASIKAGKDAALAKIAKSKDAAELEAKAKAAEKAADVAQKAADEAQKRLDKAHAESDAADKTFAAKDTVADSLEADQKDADKALAAETAAEQRVADREAQRDRPEVSTEKEVDLDADDAANVRAEATAARDAMEKGFEENATSIAKARDDAAVERYDNEQAAKSAQMQVKREQKSVDEARSKAERLNREADSVEAKDPALAASLRENARRAGTDQRIAESRLEAAQQRANAKLEASKEAGQRVEQLEKQSKDLVAQRDQAEKAVDGLEERARLLEEAQQKLSQAETTGDPKLRAEAEALVERAEKVHVDRPSIEAVTTPVTPVTAPQPAPAPTTEPQATTEPPKDDDTQVATVQGAPVDDDLVGDDQLEPEAQRVAMAGQGQTGLESQHAAAGQGQTGLESQDAPAEGSKEFETGTADENMPDGESSGAAVAFTPEPEPSSDFGFEQAGEPEPTVAMVGADEQQSADAEADAMLS